MITNNLQIFSSFLPSINVRIKPVAYFISALVLAVLLYQFGKLLCSSLKGRVSNHSIIPSSGSPSLPSNEEIAFLPPKRKTPSAPKCVIT